MDIAPAPFRLAPVAFTCLMAGVLLSGCGGERESAVDRQIRHLEVYAGIEEDGAVFFDWEGQGITEVNTRNDGLVVWPEGAFADGTFSRADVELRVVVERAMLEDGRLTLEGTYVLRGEGTATLTLLGTGETREADVTYSLDEPSGPDAFRWEGRLHAVFTNANADQGATLEGDVLRVR